MNKNKISENLRSEISVTCADRSRSIRMPIRNGTQMTRMQAARINTDQISENQRSEISAIREPIRNGTLITPMQATRIRADKT